MILKLFLSFYVIEKSGINSHGLKEVQKKVDTIRKTTGNKKKMKFPRKMGMDPRDGISILDIMGKKSFQTMLKDFQKPKEKNTLYIVSALVAWCM